MRYSCNNDVLDIETWMDISRQVVDARLDNSLFCKNIYLMQNTKRLIIFDFKPKHVLFFYINEGIPLTLSLMQHRKERSLHW